MAVALLVALVVAVVAAIAGAIVLTRRVRAERAGADRLATELAAARAHAEAVTSERDAAAERAARADALLQALWSLELSRVAREWALTTGAVDAVGTVAADTGAELTTALRMELERRREESGVPGDLDGSSSVGAVPVASALSTLRLVEEVLAAVSRPSEGFTVGMRVDGAAVVTTITLDAADADVPAVLRAVASDAGASIAVAGSTVTVAVPC